MSIMGVPEFSAFPPVLLSSTMPPTPLTGIRLNPCAVWPIQLQKQVMEPKFCSDVSSEHTLTNLPRRKSGFNLENDATIAASEQANSSRHSVASTVPTLFRTRKLVADADHETVVSVEESVSGEKRDRALNVVQMLKDRQNLHTILERKAELAAQGDCVAQKRIIRS